MCVYQNDKTFLFGYIIYMCKMLVYKITSVTPRNRAGLVTEATPIMQNILHVIMYMTCIIKNWYIIEWLLNAKIVSHTYTDTDIQSY